MTSNRSIDNASQNAAKTLVRAFQATGPSVQPPMSGLPAPEKFDYQDAEARREEDSKADISDSTNSWKKMNLKFTALFAGRSDDDNDPNDPDSAAAKEEQRKEDDEKFLEIMEALSDDTRESLETYKLLRTDLVHRHAERTRDFEHCRQNYIEAQRQESLAYDAVTLATDDVRKADGVYKATQTELTERRDDLTRDIATRQPSGANAPDNRDVSVETLSAPGEKDLKAAAWEKHGAAIDAIYAKSGLTQAFEIVKGAEATKNNPTLHQPASEELTRATKAIKDAGLPLSPDEALVRHLKENDPQNPYLKTIDAKISAAIDAKISADQAEKYLADKHTALKESQRDLQRKIQKTKDAEGKMTAAEADLIGLENQMKRLDKKIAETETFQKKLPELRQGLKDKTITPAQFLEQMPDHMRDNFLNKNPDFRKALESGPNAPADTTTAIATRTTASDSAANQVYGEATTGKTTLTASFTRAQAGPSTTEPATNVPEREPERHLQAAQNGLG